MASYWEGAGGTYPQTLTVDLGANNAITRVVVKLNASWGTRTQTIQVLGHNLSTTTFGSLVAPATYTFNPASANTVTIPVTATVSAVRVTFTANSGATAGQAAELEVYGGTATATATARSRTGATPTATPRARATATATVRSTATPTLCRAVGVDIYADVVFNHTASLNGGGTGSGGSPWSLKSMPMYSSPDYHNLTCSIDYNNASTVQNCDLVGLPDLNTGSTYVRQTEANFANDLLAIGVNGFRIDAAKHMSPPICPTSTTASAAARSSIKRSSTTGPRRCRPPSTRASASSRSSSTRSESVPPSRVARSGI